MKKIKLKRFFRSFFPMNSYLYCLFQNLDTGAYELVSRSGYVFLTVPRLPCLTDEEHKKLFLEVVFCLEKSSFADDGLVSSRLCQLEKVQRWEAGFSFEPSYFDVSSFPIHEYSPSDMIS